jgi:hypothetical protein
LTFLRKALKKTTNPKIDGFEYEKNKFGWLKSVQKFNTCTEEVCTAQCIS